MAKRTPSTTKKRSTPTRKVTKASSRTSVTTAARKAARAPKATRRPQQVRHPELHARGVNHPDPHHAATNGIQLPGIAKRRSKFAGWGVYALERITKNTRIIAYTGEKIDHKESLKREAKYLETGEIWCFKLNNRWVIDASVGGNNARFINHACKPNCYTQIVGGVIWVRAGRTIAPGEELTYNYYTEGEAEIPCKCRPGCKGMI